MLLIKTEHHRKYKIIIIITVHVQKKYYLVKRLVVYWRDTVLHGFKVFQLISEK